MVLKKLSIILATNIPLNIYLSFMEVFIGCAVQTNARSTYFIDSIKFRIMFFTQVQKSLLILMNSFQNAQIVRV